MKIRIINKMSDAYSEDVGPSNLMRWLLWITLFVIAFIGVVIMLRHFGISIGGS